LENIDLLSRDGSNSTTESLDKIPGVRKICNQSQNSSLYPYFYLRMGYFSQCIHHLLQYKLITGVNTFLWISISVSVLKIHGILQVVVF